MAHSSHWNDRLLHYSGYILEELMRKLPFEL